MKARSIVVATLFGLLLFGAISLVLVVSFFGWAPLAHYGLMAEWASSDRDVLFHGRVVDQDGAPIAGATVTLSVETFDSRSVNSNSGQHLKRESFQRITGLQGRFSVEGLVGRTLYIERVEHPQYVTFPEPNDPTYVVFDYWAKTRGTVYSPISTMPATFPLRKHGEIRRLMPTRGGKDVKVP